MIFCDNFAPAGVFGRVFSFFGVFPLRDARGSSGVLFRSCGQIRWRFAARTFFCEISTKSREILLGTKNREIADGTLIVWNAFAPKGVRERGPLGVRDCRGLPENLENLEILENLENLENLEIPPTTTTGLSLNQ